MNPPLHARGRGDAPPSGLGLARAGGGAVRDVALHRAIARLPAGPRQQARGVRSTIYGLLLVARGLTVRVGGRGRGRVRVWLRLGVRLRLGLGLELPSFLALPSPRRSSRGLFFAPQLRGVAAARHTLAPGRRFHHHRYTTATVLPMLSNDKPRNANQITAQQEPDRLGSRSSAQLVNVYSIVPGLLMYLASACVRLSPDFVP